MVELENQLEQLEGIKKLSDIEIRELANIITEEIKKRAAD